MSAGDGSRAGAVVTLGETMALITAPSGRHLRGGTNCRWVSAAPNRTWPSVSRG